VSARDTAALDGFVAQHSGALALPVDVCDMRQVRTRRGRSCAGPARPGAVLRRLLPRAARHGLRPAQALRHQEVNYVGALHVIDAVLPGAAGARRPPEPGGKRRGVTAACRKAWPYGPTKAGADPAGRDACTSTCTGRAWASAWSTLASSDTPLTAQNRFHMPALADAGAGGAGHAARLGEGQASRSISPGVSRWGLKLLRLLPFGWYAPLVKRGTGAVNTSQAVDRIVTLFEGMRPRGRGRDSAAWYTADAWFKDPFNEVRGLAGRAARLRHMFEALEQAPLSA
jgi:hypothetical protein